MSALSTASEQYELLPAGGGHTLEFWSPLHRSESMWGCFMTLEMDDRPSCILYTTNMHWYRYWIFNWEQKWKERDPKWSSRKKKERRRSALLSSWDELSYWLSIKGVVKAFSYDPDLYSFCKTNTCNFPSPQHIDLHPPILPALLEVV